MDHRPVDITRTRVFNQESFNQTWLIATKRDSFNKL